MRKIISVLLAAILLISPANAQVVGASAPSGLTYPTCSIVGTCKACYGTYLLNKSYTGNAFTVTRASDSTTSAIPFTSAGVANWATVNTFCSGTTCGVSTLNDQCGGGYDLTQATAANMPQIDGDTVGNMQAITFGPYHSATWLNNTSFPITNIQNFSLYAGMASYSNGITLNGSDGGALFELGNPTYKYTILVNSPPYQLGAYGATLHIGGLVASPQAMSWRDISGKPTVKQNQRTTSYSSAVGSSAATGLQVGYTDIAANWAGTFDLASLIIYDSALSTANDAMAQASINDTIQVPQNIQNNVIMGVDSITAGISANGTPPQQTLTGQLWPLLKQQANLFNVGQPSQTLANFLTYLTTGSSDYLNSTYAIAPGMTVFVINGGDNDFADSSSTTAATVYSNIQTACSNIHAASASYKCVVTSLLCRTGTFTGGANSTNYESRRQTLETSLVAGWSGFADGFIDLTADPIMGPQSACSNTALYADGIHPTGIVGYGYVAADYASVLNSILP